MVQVKNVEETSMAVDSKTQELKDLMHQTIEIDSIRIENVLKIAIKGLQMNKVWKSMYFTNEESFTRYTPTIKEYLEVNGVKIKGVKVDSYRGEEYASDMFVEKEDKYELWLTNKGFMKTHLFGDNDKVDFDSPRRLEREIIGYDYDPLTVKEDFTFEWDVDNIIQSIQEHLLERENDLNDRIAKQKARLNKLKELKII